jgi:hypothetical protein
VRKFLVILAVAVLALGLFSPAQAAKKSTKSYSVSLSPSPSGTQKKYNDTSLDLSSGHGPAWGQTIIRGRVKGGNVKGKKVAIYATNLHTQAKKRAYLGSATIGKGGIFDKKFAPADGHAGLYKIEIVKAAGAGRKAKTKSFQIRVYEWNSLSYYFAPTLSTGQVERADKEQTGTGRNANERWSTSYALTGDSTATFDFRGYRCTRFNLKLALSQKSRVDAATYQVSQPGRSILSGSLSRGGSYVEPNRPQSENVSADGLFSVTVSDAEAGADARTILGLPKAACLYPTKLAAAPY